MRQSILAGIALVATVSVSALILPSSTENENKISVAGRLTYEPWCFCGVDHGIDADETGRCCRDPSNFDGHFCKHLDLYQLEYFIYCCDNATATAMCGDTIPSVTKRSVAVNQPNAAHIAGQNDGGEKDSWCYCDGDVESKDDSQTNMCCPTGHYDLDLLVCNYLKPSDIVSFEGCCAEQEVVCGINGTNPNNAVVSSPPAQSVETDKADTTPAPSSATVDEHFGPPFRGHTTSYSGPWPSHRPQTTSYITLWDGPLAAAPSQGALEERFGPPYRGFKACFVGHCCPPVKYDVNTLACCPKGHYNSTRALCLDLNDDLVHDFVQMARDLEIEAYCFYQMPDSITIGPQGPTKTEQLRLRTPEPGHLIECWAGIDSKSKTAALTKKCCPGGYYDEQKEVCQDLTPNSKHEFLRCLPDHIATCDVQTPKADSVLV